MVTFVGHLPDSYGLIPIFSQQKGRSIISISFIATLCAFCVWRSLQWVHHVFASRGKLAVAHSSQEADRKGLMMAWNSFILVVLALGFSGVFTGVMSSAQTAHYISKSLGSDSNNGTSKLTPWQHLPGMPSAIGNAASYTPVAGDSFVLYGGDTWGAADLGINWTNISGSASNCTLPYGSGATSSCIHLGGLDTTWYSTSVCGSSYCRPIFSAGGGAITNPSNSLNYFIWIYDNSADYIVIDNINFSGFYDNGTSSGGYVGVNGDNIELRNNYFHGWTHGSGSPSVTQTTSCGGGSGSCVNTFFDNNVIDGSDTTQDMFQGIYAGTWDQIYNNYCQWVVVCFEPGAGHIIHDNVITNLVENAPVGHADGVFMQTAFSSSNFIYNNVFSNSMNAPGAWMLAINANSGVGTPNTNFYLFGNISYNLGGPLYIFTGHAIASYGNFYLFNNSVECGSDASYGGCTGVASPPTGWEDVWEYNDYYVSSNPTINTCNTTVPSGGTCTGGAYPPNIVQNLTQVGGSNGQNGENAEYVWSPNISGSSTVGVGVNEQSMCSTIAAINTAAGTACQYDTTYAVGYNPTTHAVIAPARTPQARPSTGAWDAGAYQYSSSGSQVSPPPSNLKGAAVVVQ